MIYRRFSDTAAVWCREIAIPALVCAVLVTASSPAHDVYSLSAADVAPLAADTTRASVNVPLSSEPLQASSLASEAAVSSEAVTTATIPQASPQGDAPAKDAIAKDASATDTNAKDAIARDAPATEASADPAQAADVPNAAAPAAKGPVLAALEMPDESLPKPSLNKASPRETAPPRATSPQTDEVYDAASSIEIHDECLVMDVCVDRYLWQLYQRTPKEDSIKESREKQVTIKKKGKLKTVTRSWTVVVDEDFGWKDPKAAKNAGMSLADYVIGGVDRDFKQRLFSMLHAADQAGLSPGITSGFRDDYRQSIASGLKAASNRSYHGGSLRGGYGHGLAADIVSVKGATRAERLANSDVLWKWIDDHGREFGLGRPYLGRDPPHVAPNDGEEFARHRPGAKTRQASN